MMTNEIKVSMTRHDNQLLMNSCANFGQTNSERTVPHAGNIRLKEILKRRALFGNQTVVLLTGSGALTNSGASNPFFLKLL
jgi:hypothetical protein